MRSAVSIIRTGWISCLIAGLISSASAANAPVLNPANVTKAVREANIFEADAQITSYISGKEIIVQSFLNPKANDNDCKIDAVLIGKAIFDVFPPPAFSNIRVNFYDINDRTRSIYRSVIVRAGDIEVFAKGSISKEALLSSLTVGHERLTNVVKQTSPRAILNVPISGEFRKKERQSLLSSLRELQLKNQELGREVADVDKCCTLFALSEDAVRKQNEHGFVRTYNDAIIALNEEQAKVNRAVTELYHKLPVQGPQYARRVAVYKRLEYLERHGKDVTQLRRIFEKDVEPRARMGQDDLELDVSLSTVERALNKM